MQDIIMIRMFPWHTVGGWIHEMIPLEKTESQMQPNQAVDRIVLDIPSEMRSGLKPFGKPVSRLDVISIFEPQKMAVRKLDPNFLDVVLVVHHDDGSWQLGLPSYINASKKSPQEIKEDISAGAKHICLVTHSQVENAYMRSMIDLRTGKRKFFRYDSMASGSYHNERAIKFYVKAPKFIFESLVSEISTNISLSEKSANGVTLIFLGCGTGKEVVIGKRYVEEKLKVPVYSHGIDIQPGLIKKAKENFRDYWDETCSVAIGDALEADSIIRKSIKERQPDGLVIVIAIGLVSEGVLQGTYPAHRILQGIAQSQRVDMVFEARYGAHFFTYDTAKAAGWAVKRQVIPEDVLRSEPVHQDDTQKLAEVLHILTPVSLEKQAEDIVQRLSDNIIDLSLSSYPMKMFREIVQRHPDLKFDTVDMSWANMESNKKYLHDSICEMQAYGVRSIIVSGYEPWFKEFKSEFSCLNVMKRTDSREEFELPSLLPNLGQKIWRNYKVYKDLSSGHVIRTERLKSTSKSATANDEDLQLPLARLSLVKPSGNS